MQRRPENQFIEILDSEADDVSIFEDVTADFCAVDEKSVALAAILDVIMACLADKRGTLARNTRILELQMLGGFTGAADEERGLRDAYKTAGAARFNDFEAGFAAGWSVRHSRYSKRKL